MASELKWKKSLRINWTNIEKKVTTLILFNVNQSCDFMQASIR